MRSTQESELESSGTLITVNGCPISHVIVKIPSGGFAIYTNTDYQSERTQFSESPASLSITPVTASSLSRLDQLLTEIGFMRHSSLPDVG